MGDSFDINGQMFISELCNRVEFQAALPPEGFKNVAEVVKDCLACRVPKENIFISPEIPPNGFALFQKGSLTEVSIQALREKGYTVRSSGGFTVTGRVFRPVFM